MPRYAMSRRLLTVIVGVVTLIGVFAPAANAGTDPGVAHLYHKQSLAQDPTSNMSPTCHSRHIYLAGGYYGWNQNVWYDEISEGDPNQYVILGQGADWDNIKLAAHWYTWSSCLYPEDNEYYQLSSLIRDGYSSGSVIDHTYGTPDNFWHTGNHIWGDSLYYYGTQKD